MRCTPDVIRHFAQQFDSKRKCPKCKGSCKTGLCVDDCLSYAGKFPDYKCNFLRSAYVLRYFCVHKAEMKKLLGLNYKRIQNHLSLDSKDSITVVSLGAGPGTDFFAFIEWLDDYSMIDTHPTVKFLRIDKEDDWVNQLADIKNIYDPTIKKLFSKAHFMKNITDILTLPEKNKEEYDILSLSYILSEIKDSAVNLIWNNLRGRLSRKCIILLNDRPEAAVTNKYDKFKSLIKKDFPRSEFIDYSFSSFLNYGIKRDDTHCDENYPEDYRQMFKAKLNCTSCQSIIFKK